MKININDPAVRLSAIVLVFFAFSFFSLFFYTFAADEYTYMNNAEQMAQGKFFELSDQIRFPAFPFLLSLFYKVFGPSELVAKILNLLLGLASVLLLYFVVDKFFGKDVAFWSSLIFAANPFFLFLVSRVFSEPLYFVLLILNVFLIYKSGEDAKFLPFLGAAFALLILNRYMGLYLAPVFLIYLIYKKKLDALLTRHFAFGILAFLLVMSPFFYLNFMATGNPIGFMFSFLHAGVTQVQGAMGLPDKMPSYFLAMPFILAFAFPLFILFFVKNGTDFLKDDKKFIFALAILLITFSLEAYGLFNFPLLRYLAPIAPFCAVFAGLFASSLSKNWKKLVLAAVLLNVVLAFAVVYYFGAVYAKQVDHRELGLLMQKNCNSTYSNADFLVFHYTKSHSAPLNQTPECIAITNYEGGPNDLRIPNGYLPVANNSGYFLYKRY